jgi:hypothetical protein
MEMHQRNTWMAECTEHWKKLQIQKKGVAACRAFQTCPCCNGIKKCQGLRLGIKSCRIAPASAHEKSGGRLHRDAGSQRNAFIPESAAARCAPLSCGVPGT